MTLVRDVYDFLDSIAPFDTQEVSDNSGLQTGAFDLPVTRAMCCLDVTPPVIEQAAKANCELIVSHHPVLYHARKQLLCNDPAWLLARHNIACIATHTPFDACADGVNDTLIRFLALGEPQPLGGLTRKFKLAQPMSAKKLAQYAAQKIGIPVRFCDAGRLISTVGVCAGQGCGFLADGYGVTDAFFTGDANHNNFLDAMQHGISLFAAGHFETEVLAVPVLAQRLREVFPALEWLVAEETSVIQHV